MSENKRIQYPFENLGNKLKSVRVERKRSLSEVSGAVEIDDKVLEQIERGEQRPAEEILALLISYFELKEEEATSIWKLAGYDDKSTGSSVFELNQPIAFAMPMDLRVVYTDMVHVMINNYGVVMNFMQSSGQKNQPLAVSRIGMSKEHARSVIEILEQSLKQADQQDAPKLLKPSTKKTDQADNKKEK
ncbi:MAG: family transcriptional regulator [Patescibacteria group bacterium]|nr:family transcriptional regulator [Patescibacteria group bacterium]